MAHLSPEDHERDRRPKTPSTAVTKASADGTSRLHRGRGTSIRAAWWLIAAPLLMAGCQGSVDVIDLEPPINVENGTELAVEVFVNDELVADYPPGAVGTVEADLPPLPWRVEARTSTGRVLTSFTVAPGDVQSGRGSGGVEHYSGPLGRVDLSCGRLSLWAGDFTPSGPAPGPNPGRPGDCEP